MHGNIHELVCPECGEVSGISPPQLRAIRAKRPLRCGGCGDADLRCRVMLYDDGEGGRNIACGSNPKTWFPLACFVHVLRSLCYA